MLVVINRSGVDVIKMNVGELIEELLKYDKELPVIIGADCTEYEFKGVSLTEDIYGNKCVSLNDH